jgi:DNA-binding transcriptional MocR family regulator
VRRPTGGISAWARLPGPDATRLAAVAAEHAIRLSPGPAFSVDGTFEHHIRLPFTLPPETITTTISTLARLAAELADGDARDPRGLAASAEALAV